jgi:uncharacterized damage-inducible protein DinB
MSVGHFRSFIDHAYWGLDELLDALEQSPDRLDEEVLVGAQTPRTTLRHMFAFERGFLARLEGRDTQFRDPTPEDLAELRAQWEPIRQGWRDLLDSLSDEDLDAPLEVSLFDARYRTTRANILSQFVQHQGQHRSELAVMASTFGHSPGEFDWWNYLAASGQPIERL